MSAQILQPRDALTRTVSEVGVSDPVGGILRYQHAYDLWDIYFLSTYHLGKYALEEPP